MVRRALLGWYPTHKDRLLLGLDIFFLLRIGGFGSIQISLWNRNIFHFGGFGKMLNGLCSVFQKVEFHSKPVNKKILQVGRFLIT